MKTLGMTKFRDYMRLMRMEKPIGSFLLLAPTWLALWLAAEGMPSIKHLIVFTLGVFIMRSAGCVVNDLADRNFDKHVERTKERPITSGRVTVSEAFILLFALLLLALILVLQTSLYTLAWSVPALLLAMIYPLMKRYTHFPQVVLGAAFSMSIIMAFAAEAGEVTELAAWLYLANLLWVVAYDTQYAMTDREDDLKIGVKSTAIAFGHWDRLIIGILQVLTLLMLALIPCFITLPFAVAWFGALLLTAALFIYQQKLTLNRDPAQCFQAFLNNLWVGLIWVAGLWISLS